MTASDNIGQYSIAEDSNGDLVFVHPNNGQVLKYDQSEDTVEVLKGADANGNDVNDIGALQADDIHITNIGSEGKLIRDYSQAAGRNAADIIKYTDGVSTSFTGILDFQAASSFEMTGAFVIVTGALAGDISPRFTDLLHVDRSEASTVSNLGDSSPASRTYQINADILELQMASDTYNVVVSGITQRIVG